MPTRRRPKPQQAMLDRITGYWVSQMIFVAAKLGIADVLAKGAKTPETIADQVGAHAPFVHRVLRTLASVGVFAETANGRFRLTPMAATLRSGVPGSLRDFALMMIDDYNWLAWGALFHGVQTGGVAFDHVHGQRFFEYLAAHSDKEQRFSASMASIPAPRTARSLVRSTSAASDASSTSAVRTAISLRRSSAATRSFAACSTISRR